jgi:hypothetical protein
MQINISITDLELIVTIVYANNETVFIVDK